MGSDLRCHPAGEGDFAGVDDKTLEIADDCYIIHIVRSGSNLHQYFAMNRSFSVVVVLSLTSVFAGVAVAAPDPTFGEWRGLWVTRFDYQNGNANTVNSIIDNAATLGITDLMFQVRGQSDAFYDSNYETRAQALSGSWDPLQTAIDRAHGHGIKLHAWINTTPLWNGTTAPSNPNHIFYNDDPSYRVFDLNGNPQPLKSGYVPANIISPQWQTHVNNVANDIVGNYDVDGLHLDYIRWTDSISHSALPHDAQSHQMFQQATGLDAANPANVGAYRDFIRGRLTNLVADLQTTVKSANTSAQLSAAVWRDPDVGNNDYLQNYRHWLEQDLLDVAIPMIYLSPSNNYLFEPNLNNTLSIDTSTRIAPGLGIYLHNDPDFSVQQISDAYQMGAGGITLYAYSSFFSSGSLGQDRINTIIPFLDSIVTLPRGGVFVNLTDFNANEGHFGYSPTLSGSNSGILSGTTAVRTTSEAHEGAGSQRITVVGDANGWFLRHLSGDGSGTVASPSANIPLDAHGSVGFWLMTNDAGLEVAIALDDPDSADVGARRKIIDDGQWHLYEWDLENDLDWTAWANQDGIITGPTVWLDSIQFWGAGNAVIYLDSIFYRTHSAVPEPGVGTLILLGMLLTLRRKPTHRVTRSNT